MSEDDTSHDSTVDGHDADHGHAPAAAPLGPVDLTAWGYAIAGSVLGLLVVLALYVARGG